MPSEAVSYTDTMPETVDKTGAGLVKPGGKEADIAKTIEALKQKQKEGKAKPEDGKPETPPAPAPASKEPAAAPADQAPEPEAESPNKKEKGCCTIL